MKILDSVLPKIMTMILEDRGVSGDIEGISHHLLCRNINTLSKIDMLSQARYNRRHILYSGNYQKTGLKILK